MNIKNPVVFLKGMVVFMENGIWFVVAAMFFLAVNIFVMRLALKKKIGKFKAMHDEFIAGIPEELTKEYLEGLEDKELGDTIYNFIYFKKAGTVKHNELFILKSLDETVSSVYFVYTLQMLAKNGGIHQFFLCTDDEFVLLTIKALDFLSLSDVSNELERAAQIYSENKEMFDKTNRKKSISSYNKLVKAVEMDSVNRLLYENKETIDNLIIKTIRDNIIKFVLN